MPKSLDLSRLLLVAVVGWMNHEQQQVIEYLREENRIQRAQMGTRRPRFDDDQRLRLAIRARVLDMGSRFSLSFANVGRLRRSPESD